MNQKPWAVLLCKFSDDDSEPFERSFYENLFTESGIGTQNILQRQRISTQLIAHCLGFKVFGGDRDQFLMEWQECNP